MSTENYTIHDRLERIEHKLDQLLAGFRTEKPTRTRQGVVLPEVLHVEREKTLERMFRRYAGGSYAFKVKNRFPSATIQPLGAKRAWEIVPRSILVNRCESQKPFWPAADGSERRTARAIVEHFLDSAIKAGALLQSTVGDLFPGTADTRTGETAVILSPAEKAYRDELDEDDDQEFAPPPDRKPWERPIGGAAGAEEKKPLRPWEDPNYVAPSRAEESEEDEEEDVEPAAKKPAVEIEGFRLPRGGAVLEGFGRKGGDA